MIKEILETDSMLICRLIKDKENMSIGDLQSLTGYHEMYLYML